MTDPVTMFVNWLYRLGARAAAEAHGWDGPTRREPRVPRYRVTIADSSEATESPSRLLIHAHGPGEARRVLLERKRRSGHPGAVVIKTEKVN